MIDGLVVLEPKIFKDDRGYFFEIFTQKKLLEKGIDMEIVQGNQSKSEKGVLRGLHYQREKYQGKLVRVLSGSIIDIAVDLRKESKTFGEYFKIKLSKDNQKILFIPKGFAHGFLSLEDETIVEYFCDEYYYPEYDDGIIWNDKELNIDWNFKEYGISEKELIISQKDKKLRKFSEVEI